MPLLSLRQSSEDVDTKPKRRASLGGTVVGLLRRRTSFVGDRRSVSPKPMRRSPHSQARSSPKRKAVVNAEELEGVVDLISNSPGEVSSQYLQRVVEPIELAIGMRTCR